MQSRLLKLICRRRAAEAWHKSFGGAGLGSLAFAAVTANHAGMSANPLLARITIDPEICHGKPCIRGLRYPVESMLEYLSGGDSVDDVLAEFPDLERDDLLACLEFARHTLATRSQHLVLT